ncbi:NAD(P)-dependent oxidoreductase [Fluviicola taffensis]|uniref:NAD-dependent epimerase/dehydratase family protein n=1 Tax=Fluviicola taffensis TaxID=191579 RepID=UPI0031383971
MERKPKLLITGANGFIGYHLIELALNYFDVYAGVRSESDSSHLTDMNATIVELDYSNVKTLADHLSHHRYDYIIHAAGATKARDLDAYNTANVTSTKNLCEAIEKSWMPKKFVFISSLAALGPLQYGKDQKLMTSSPAHPVTSYGESKLNAENMLKQHPDIPWIILRPTAVYGPREKDFLVMMKSINMGLEIYIGKEPQLFTFVYVKDLSDAIIRACLSEIQHEAYNISDGYVYEKYDFSETTKKVLDKRTVKLHVPVFMVRAIARTLELFSRNKTPLLNQEKLAELTARNWNCDIENAQSDLAYIPQYSLYKGLTETINWYKENKWI